MMNERPKGNVPALVLGALWVLTLILGVVFWPKAEEKKVEPPPPPPKEHKEEPVKKEPEIKIPCNMQAALWSEGDKIIWKKVFAEAELKWEELPEETDIYFPRYVYPVIDEELHNAKEAGVDFWELSYDAIFGRLTKSDKKLLLDSFKLIHPKSGAADKVKLHASETIRMLVRRPIIGQLAELGWSESYRQEKKQE